MWAVIRLYMDIRKSAIPDGRTQSKPTPTVRFPEIRQSSAAIQLVALQPRSIKHQTSDFRLFGNFQRVIDLDAKIPHGALQL